MRVFFVEVGVGEAWRPATKRMRASGETVHGTPWFEVEASSREALMALLAGASIHRVEEVAPGGGACLANHAECFREAARVVLPPQETESPSRPTAGSRPEQRPLFS